MREVAIVSRMRHGCPLHGGSVQAESPTSDGILWPASRIERWPLLFVIALELSISLISR